MIKGFATHDGTLRYKNRFASSGDYFNLVDGLHLSSLGFGTFRKEPYREEPYLFSYEPNILTSLENGINHFDTASNYRYQESEKELGVALKIAHDRGFERDEYVVASKAGFIPLEFPFPKDPYAWIKERYLSSGMVAKEDIIVDQHILTADFIEHSLEQSLTNLGLETLDIFYIHNPEFELGYVEYPKLLEKLKAIFAMLERKIAEGKIRAYGVASWNGFLNEPDHTEYLSLLDVKNVAGAGFKYLQLPYNLAKTSAYNYQNQRGADGLYYSTFALARALGLHTITSSSLLQMNLFKAPLTDKVASLLGADITTDVARALQFARTPIYVASALFSSIHDEYITSNLQLRTIPKTPKVLYDMMFKL